MKLIKKKIVSNIIFLTILFVLLIQKVSAESIIYDNLCYRFDEGIGAAFKIIGYVVLIAKWIVPLIIMVLGMVDFGKAVISSDEQAISKASKSLVTRFVAGIVVFFIPTIMLAFLNIIGVTNDIEGLDDNNPNRYSACTKCVLNATKYCK